MRHFGKVNSFSDVVMLLAADSGGVYQLAHAAGVTPTGVWHIIRGHRPRPSAQMVGKLLAAAGRPWAWLDEVLGLPDPAVRVATTEVVTGCRWPPKLQPTSDQPPDFPDS